MAEMTPGAALRQLQQAQAAMRKARQALAQARGAELDPRTRQVLLAAGWESLAAAHRSLAAIPLDAADEAVMTRQLAVQRYATALLVRLRRLLRNEAPGADDEEDLADVD